MVALVYLDRPPIRIRYDEAAAPLACLVLEDDLGSDSPQSRPCRLQGVNPKPDKGAPGLAVTGALPRATYRHDRNVHAIDLDGCVQHPVAVVLVFQGHPERSVESDAPPHLARLDHDRGDPNHRHILARPEFDAPRTSRSVFST